MTTQQILAEIEGQGVRLWEEGGAIRYTAPRGVMSKALLQQLSSSKVEVLTLLRERKESDAPGAAIRLRPDQAHAPFPLNDLQAAYLVGRDEVFEIGNIASHAYFELRKENVDLDRLKEAWRAVIARHPMLRTVILPGGMQKVLEQTPEYAIEVLDLRNASPEEREKQLEQIRSAM